MFFTVCVSIAKGCFTLGKPIYIYCKQLVISLKKKNLLMKWLSMKIYKMNLKLDLNADQHNLSLRILHDFLTNKNRLNYISANDYCIEFV